MTLSSSFLGCLDRIVGFASVWVVVLLSGLVTVMVAVPPLPDVVFEGDNPLCWKRSNTFSRWGIEAFELSSFPANFFPHVYYNVSCNIDDTCVL